MTRKSEPLAGFALPSGANLDASEILDAIHEAMSGKEWSPDTLDYIAALLERGGFTVEPYEELEEG